MPDGAESRASRQKDRQMIPVTDAADIIIHIEKSLLQRRTSLCTNFNKQIRGIGLIDGLLAMNQYR